MCGKNKAEVVIKDKSQKNLTALNNVNAAMSKVSNQTNVMGIFSHDASGSFVTQANTVSTSGDNGKGRKNKAKVEIKDKGTSKNLPNNFPDVIQ